jgi:membrane-bound lytic murein transglycosylase D
LPLPKQTKEYIPKLLALAAIVQHPHAYGMNLAPVPNKAVTKTVVIHKEMNLKTIANLAHTSVYTVKKLNPALRKSVTPPHETVTLVLPANKKTVFVQHLEANPETKNAVVENNVAHYTVKKGDSLTRIASQFKTTIDTLQRINKIRDGMIHINQVLIVPSVIPETAKEILHATKPNYKITTVTPRKSESTAEKKVTHSTHYDVHHGDDLGIIAHRFHTTRKKLEAMNHLNPRDVLHVGERLVVAKDTSAEHASIKHAAVKHSTIKHTVVAEKKSASTEDHKTVAQHDVGLRSEHVYIVRRGDDLRKLAKEFDTTTYHIMLHNHLKTVNLSIGQRLMLPNA